MKNIVHKIPRFKGEMPLYIVLFFVWLFGSMVLFAMLSWVFIILWALVLVLLLFGMRKSGNSALHKTYYIKADETGVAYQLHIFSKETKLIWELISDIDVLMHEINFRLMDSSTVTSLVLSTMEDEEKKEFKKFVYQSFYRFKEQE